MKLTMDIVLDLLKNVVFKYKDDNALKYIKTTETDLEYKIILSKILIFFIYPNKDKLFENCKSLLDFYIKLGMNKKEIKKSLADLFIIYKKWLVKYQNFENFDKNLNEIYINVFNTGIPSEKTPKEEENEDFFFDNSDDFFMFEGEDVDENINNMHYDDNEKISAKEFFEYNEISEEEIADIIESCEEFDYVLANTFEINNEIIHQFIEILHYLAKVLHITQEFADVGYAFDNLANELRNLDFRVFNEEKRLLAFELLKQISIDIKKWVEEVFIYKTANDIHYFDASFLSNITQMKLILEMN